MTRTLVLLFAALAVAQGQTPTAPSFQADHVYFFDHPVPLAPGVNLTIFGNDLGPLTGCQGQHDAQANYPTELCETQVLVGGIPAGLLWVQASQINFRVPHETPIQGTADLLVMYRGRSSTVVAMPLGREVPTLSVENPARVGMPVWLKVNYQYGEDSGIRYPFQIYPASFGCNEVEVRRNGMPLPKIADIGSQAFGTVAMIGNPCGGIGFRSEPHFKNRFPLHLVYRFDRPGIYEVRLSQPRSYPSELPSVTAWTKIEILPADASARKQWLAEKVAHAPADAADLLADFLPSILGNPDDETLNILHPYLYDPDRLVREYATYGLTYWPPDPLGRALWSWMQAQGPSDATVYYFLHLNDSASPRASQLAELAIPYLQSDSPVLVRGAERALSRIVLADQSKASPELRARAETALVRAVRHDMQVDRENVNEYVSALGQVRDERAHDLLWDLVDRRGAGFEQAIIALTWRKSPPDLPKLAQLALQPANERARDYQFASLPYALHNGYGDAAIPFLSTLLARSELDYVRVNCARELVLAKRAEGFAFAADSIANGRFYKGEMIQFVRDQFPEIRESDEAAVLKFVQARAAAN